MLKSFFFLQVFKKSHSRVLVPCFPCFTDNSIDYDFLIFKKLKKFVILIMIFLLEKK
jgi:hypothetical protein